MRKNYLFQNKETVSILTVKFRLFCLAILLLTFGTTRVFGQTNVIQNPGFESGTSSWVDVVNDNAHAGTYCAKVTGDSYKSTILTGLTPNTIYTLTAWGKISTTDPLGSSNAYGKFGVKEYGGGGELPFTFTTTSYLKSIPIIFTTGASTTTVELWIWVPAPTIFYLDDLVLTGPDLGTNVIQNNIGNAHIYSQNGCIIANLKAISGQSTVSIIDVKGSVIKTVQTKGAELLSFNMTAKGVYMVRIQNGDKLSISKVIL